LKHVKALLRNKCYILVHRLAIRGRKSNNHCHGYCLTAPKVVNNSGCVGMPEKWRRLESLRCSGWKPLPLWVATWREGHTHKEGVRAPSF